MKKTVRDCYPMAGMIAFALLFACDVRAQHSREQALGREVAIVVHLREGEEYQMALEEVLAHGKALFEAVWTSQEGGGRPLTKGTGGPLSDLTQPLIFPRNFNRISAPDANSCAGCHHVPFGAAGGGGDIVANVFVLGHRFDFATFDHAGDILSTKGAVDERGNPRDWPARGNGTGVSRRLLQGDHGPRQPANQRPRG